jgi:hypothetical protein
LRAEKIHATTTADDHFFFFPSLRTGTQRRSPNRTGRIVQSLSLIGNAKGQATHVLTACLRMPPKLRALTHCSKLSWHSVPCHQCTIDRQESKDYFRRQLESFWQYLWDHYIGKFGPGHMVLAKGKYSRQFFLMLLCSLLTFDTIPDQIKIPCWHLLHVCAYCYSHPYPSGLWISLFMHILAVPRRCGRPSRHQDNTASELALYSSDGTSDNSSAHDYDYKSNG